MIPIISPSLFTAFHRGYMKQCYHKPCDHYNNPNITETNFNFLTKITQALVFAVVKMATEGDTECHLQAYVAPEVPAEVVQDDGNILDIEELLETQGGEIENDIEIEAEMEEHDEDEDDDYQAFNEVARERTQPALTYNDLKNVLNELSAKMADAQSHNAMTKPPSSHPSSWFSSPNPSTLNIGTQINIGSVHIGLPASEMLYNSLAPERPNVVLGSGDVDLDVLTKIIKNYYSKQKSETNEVELDLNLDVAEAKKDRRKYKGKHRNSPMIIKLMAGAQKKRRR